MLTEREEPHSSAEIPNVSPDRTDDVQRKHDRLAQWLAEAGYDALLLQEPHNVAWITSGADCTRFGSGQTTAAVFVTPEARLAVANNVDSPQLFERQLAGLGFQLKERPWYEPRERLVEDLCRGRNVASDTPRSGTTHAGSELRAFRLQLGEIERARLERVGERLTAVVEHVCQTCERGATESEVAGLVLQQLTSERIVPVCVQVWADFGTRRYGNWSHGRDRIQHTATISAVARKWGLHCGVARTVAFRKPSEELTRAGHLASLVQATGIHFSQPDWTLADTWKRVARIYEKFGRPDDWHEHEQADVIGYLPAEERVVPHSQFRLQPHMAIFWHPQVTPAVVGDTLLVAPEGPRILTPAGDWPRLAIQVKDTRYERPGILQRDG